MKKHTRWFTLAAAAAVAVAAAGCGAASVSGPSDVAAAPQVEAEGTASTTALAIDACRTIDRVEVTAVPSPAASKIVWIRAEYFAGRLPVKCGIAPRWSSSPRGVLVPSLGGFRVGVERTPISKSTLVSATAPTGAVGRIQIAN